MATEVRLPELGENIETADISSVLVAKGDRIRADQPVIEVETEKASLEVPSTVGGTVAEVRVSEGETIRVGQVIVVVDSSAEAAEEVGEPGKEAQADEEPETAEEPRAADEAEAEPDAQAEAPPAKPAAGVVAFPKRGPRAEPELGDPVPAPPSVRALARELGVEIAEVEGSGPAGRISRADVKAHAKRRLAAAGRGAAARAPAIDLPDVKAWGEIERKPLSAVRRATARVMATAWSTVPHVTQFDHADITQLESMRRKFNARAADTGRKLTLTAIVIKIAAAALKQFPKLNAALDMSNETVIYRKSIHIGVAVDTERGLLVPVIRDADRAGLLQVASRLDDLASRARSKKLEPDEMRGASFTVTNLGGLGTTYFSPIVNWPEVAILGVGRAQTQAVWEEGQFKPGLILPLSLSYDHRLIDGADAARFLRWVAEALEQPLLLLLEDPTDD